MFLVILLVIVIQVYKYNIFDCSSNPLKDDDQPGESQVEMSYRRRQTASANSRGQCNSNLQNPQICPLSVTCYIPGVCRKPKNTRFFWGQELTPELYTVKLLYAYGSGGWV